MIPLDGKVASIAASMPVEGDPRAVSKALYDHTLERMKYDKPESGGWGRGDAEWACDARYGNCTDFHSYFIGLARTKHIPARFEMGFSVPAGPEEVAKIGGYHCWAYFWDDGHGWVPVDISEADKDATKAEYFFGTLDDEPRDDDRRPRPGPEAGPGQGRAQLLHLSLRRGRRRPVRQGHQGVLAPEPLSRGAPFGPALIGRSPSRRPAPWALDRFHAPSPR